MILGIDHLVITTANMEACIAFYVDLGFEARKSDGRWELFAGNFKINVHYQGKELEPKALHVQSGSADICLESTESPEWWLEMLRQKQREACLGPVWRHGARGRMRSVYLRDPDGNLIELCCYGAA